MLNRSHMSGKTEPKAAIYLIRRIFCTKQFFRPRALPHTGRPIYLLIFKINGLFFNTKQLFYNKILKTESNCG